MSPGTSIAARGRDALGTLARPFLQDRLLHGLLVAAIGLGSAQPFTLSEYPGWIDWRTILTLTGLLLLTKGIELSGYLDHLGRVIINRLRHERPLAIFLVSAAALLSAVLTNDIALFIVVPLTLGLRSVAGLPVARLVIFEALAVNAGSLLTPIGNPQNILLWQQSGLSFWAFTAQMAPLAGASMALLWLSTALAFPNDPIQAALAERPASWDTRLLCLCAVLYAGFVAGVEWGHPGPALLAVLACLLLGPRRILLQADWSLIAVFVLMFIDIRLLTQLPAVTAWLQVLPQHGQGQLYLSALLGSQVISNVPATILLVDAVGPGKLLAYAVNAGGFGFVLGSLANLIALRMVKERGVWLRFHFYSVPFLAAVGLFGYALL